MPPLGIGTWQWGDRLVWGFGADYAESDVEDAFRAAVEGGIRFFDTAEVYGASLSKGLGRSEELLGKANSDVGAHGVDDVQIGSKYFPFPWRWGRRSLLKACRASAARLQTPSIDLYQLHWPLPPRSLELWANALADAIEAGLVREVGVSNCSAAQMRRVQAALRDRGLRLTSNQIEYSLLQRKAERNGILDACRDNGITVIAYSPLAQGWLTGKYGPGRPFSGIRGLRYNRKLAAFGPFLERFEAIATEVDATPAQLALAWAISKGVLAIPGAKNAYQASQNAGALDVTLEDALIDELDRLSERAPRL